MKRIIVYLSLLIALILSSTESLAAKETTITMKTITSESGDIYYPSMVDIHSLEKPDSIELKSLKYPDNYKIAGIFNLCFQKEQYESYRLFNSEILKKSYIFQYGKNEYKKLETKYTKQYVDCIISAALLQVDTTEYRIVFDQNNDEDLSNDPILSFDIREVYNDYTKGQSEVYYVRVPVEFEYYDGRHIHNTPYEFVLLMPREYSLPSLQFFVIPQSIKQGVIRIDNKTYNIALYNLFLDIEFDKSAYFCIDMNDDGNFTAPEDYFQQLIRPMTIALKYANVTFIERFGNSCIINIDDEEKNSPIDIGFHAPDFNEKNYNGKKVTLRALKGKYVVLDFWTCHPIESAEILQETYNRSRQNNVKFVGILYDFPENSLLEIPKIKPKWGYINDPNKDIDGNPELRVLYQVGSSNTIFIIDPTGIIIARDEISTADQFLKLLNTYIK